MGEVFLCGKPELEAEVALKTFQKRFFLDRTVRRAFLREAAIWARLRTIPGVVPVLEFKHIDGRPFVLMPAFSSKDGDATLRGRIRRGPIAPEEVYRFAFQISNALFMASRQVEGLVHGDLKPENVLLATPRQALVSDFGLSHAAGMHAFTALATTRAYRAPECWRGAGLTVRSDVYAFGVLLYELLCGQRPFRPWTLRGWARAHTRKQPRRQRVADGMASSLLELALRCLEKDPAGRPADFGQIGVMLEAIGQQHDPELARQTVASIFASIAMMEQARSHLQVGTVQMLLEVHEPQLALDELQTIPDEHMSAKLWTLHGTALSLTDRDDEALECFARALELETDPTQRLLIESERGLSLKRLGRHDEAIGLFERLLPRADEQHLAQIVVNLATSLIEADRPRDAVKHLARFTRHHPDSGPAWANLGLAHQQLGEHEDALRCYQRAVHEAPHLTHVHVLYARICMEHFGAVGQAWRSLEVAFNSGADSTELFARMLVCAMLRGDKQAHARLRSAIRRDRPADEVEAIEREVKEILARIADRLVAGAAPAPAALETQPEAELGADVARSPSEPASTTPPSEGAGFEFPYVNVRYVVGENVYVIDYYDDVTDEAYAERAKAAIRQVTRTPAYQMESFEMSTHPLYFTRCSGCGFIILTNRTLGTGLACRSCDHRTPTQAVADPTGSLLDAIRVELGLSVKVTGPVMIWLLVQETAAGQLGRAEAILTEQGYTSVSLDLPVVQHMRYQAGRAGFEREAGAKAFRAVRPSSTAVGGKTPVEVEALIRRLRREIGPLYTVSNVVPIEEDGIHDLIFQGRLEEAELELRRALVDSPLDLDTLTLLAIVLHRQGVLEEAAQRAQQVTDLDPDGAHGWILRASILGDLGSHAEAIEHLDNARKLDPTNVGALSRLVAAHRALGHEAEVASLTALVRALGGPIGA